MADEYADVPDHLKPRPKALDLEPGQLAERWHTTVNALATRRWRGDGPAFFKQGKGIRARVLYKTKEVLRYEETHTIRSTTEKVTD